MPFRRASVFDRARFLALAADDLAKSMSDVECGYDSLRQAARADSTAMNED